MSLWLGKAGKNSSSSQKSLCQNKSSIKHDLWDDEKWKAQDSVYKCGTIQNVRHLPAGGEEGEELREESLSSFFWGIKGGERRRQIQNEGTKRQSADFKTAISDIITGNPFHHTTNMERTHRQFNLIWVNLSEVTSRFVLAFFSTSRVRDTAKTNHKKI